MITIDPVRPETVKLKDEYLSRCDLYLYMTKEAAENRGLMEFYEPINPTL